MPPEVLDWNTEQARTLTRLVREVATRMEGPFPSTEELCRWDARISDAVYDVPAGTVRNYLRSMHLVTDGDPARTLAGLLELLDDDSPRPYAEGW